MNLAAIYIVLFLVCTLYSIGLERIRELYSPDFVWLTVVIGNAFILAAAAAILWMEPLLAGMQLWFAFAGCFVVAGVPVIAWQVWQMVQRAQERR